MRALCSIFTLVYGSIAGVSQSATNTLLILRRPRAFSVRFLKTEVLDKAILIAVAIEILDS
jgi:hypothetical protein